MCRWRTKSFVKVDQVCHKIAMQDFILTYYPWFKAVHIISVIAWMAGLLYLPRLFVYHVDAGHDSQLSKTLKVMERRLLKAIMNPAMIASWVFGVLMIIGNPALFQQGWIHVKLLAIVLMTILHIVFGKWRKAFETDQNNRSAKFYKIWNEVPTILMIIIVLLAVVKPF